MDSLINKIKNKCAFTLAEVLITLGIIGIVAALTLPVLIQVNKNKEVETKLKKIYSVMNQAILISETANGPKEYWTWTSAKDCMEKYILPYMSSGYKTGAFVAVGNISGTTTENFIVYFSDGTALVGKSPEGGYTTHPSPRYSVDFFFYPNSKNFNLDTFQEKDENGILQQKRKGLGITFFAFKFAPTVCEDPRNKLHEKRGFEPYMWGLTALTKEALTETGSGACSLKSEHREYCTAYIRMNNWQIPKDYPFKVK